MCRWIQIVLAVLILKWSNNAEMRCRQVRTLGHLGGTRAVRALIGALSDGEGAVRIEAAKALGDVGGKLAARALIDAQYSCERDMRIEAAKALGKTGDSSAFSAILALLKHYDCDTRRNAVAVLKEIGDARAIEPLLSAALEDGTIQSAAVECIQGLGWKPSNLEQEALLAVVQPIKEFRQFGDDAIRPLIAALDSDIDTALSAFLALLESDHPSTKEPLAKKERRLAWRLDLIDHPRGIYVHIDRFQDRNADLYTRRKALAEITRILKHAANKVSDNALRDIAKLDTIYDGYTRTWTRVVSERDPDTNYHFDVHQECSEYIEHNLDPQEVKDLVYKEMRRRHI